RRESTAVGLAGDPGSGRVRDGGSCACRGSRGARPRVERRRRGAEDRGNDGVSCGGESQLSAEAPEEAVYRRRIGQDRLFIGLSTRAAGDPAADEARNREKLSAKLSGRSTMRGLLGFTGMTVGGWIGWWLGAYVGLFTAVVISGIGTGVGL